MIRKAIDIEKETISFYAGLNSVLNDDASVEAVRDIMREELSHVVTLGRLLRTR